jgi:hypothetical protein
MVREINFTASRSNKSTTKQWGGMQYEDNATKIVFDISVFEDIENALYRIDFNSPGAGYQPSENLAKTGNKIERFLPKLVTQYGGEIQVTAVITMLDNDDLPTGESISYPVTVWLTDVEKDENGSDTVEGNISQMEKVVKEKTNQAVSSASEAAYSAQAAKVAAAQTKLAKAALTDGTSLFVFSGGNAETASKVDLVVDSTLSTASENPIQNMVVAESLQSLNERVENNKDDAANSFHDLNSRVNALENFVVKRTLINAANGNPSLMKWCNENVREGLQIIQLGAGITDLPDTSIGLVCALYLCNDKTGDNLHGRRTLIIPGHDGNLYIRHFITTEESYKGWQSWYKFGGTKITVSEDDPKNLGG